MDSHASLRTRVHLYSVVSNSNYLQNLMYSLSHALFLSLPSSFPSSLLSPPSLSTPADCSSVTVDMTTTEPSGGYVNVTITSSTLTPVHRQASTTTFHIWMPSNVQIFVSDTTLRRVTTWKNPTSCSDTRGQFQTARINVTADFASGNSQFTADVLPLVSQRVSSSLEGMLIYRIEGIFRGPNFRKNPVSPPEEIFAFSVSY